MRVVESPRDSIQDPGDAVLRNAPAKQGIALEGAKGIILYFGMRWGSALSDEIEVNIGAERGRIEQNEPNVDAQLGLE